MKIKGWVFALVVAGTLVLGAAGGFVVSQGVSLAGLLLQNIRQARTVAAPDASAGMPRMHPGQRRSGQDDWNSRESRTNRNRQQKQDGWLPPGFNAGVSVPSVYGEMTGRTQEQAQAAARDAHTDVWGLAIQEGKLDELKQKVRAAVTASLDRMVADGSITQAQKDTYLKRVDLILEFAGRVDTTKGPGRGNWQGDPAATGGPETTA